MTVLLGGMLIAVGFLTVKQYIEDENHYKKSTACDVLSFDAIYLAVNETVEFNYSVEVDETILKLEDHILTAISPGKYSVQTDDCHNIDIVVTDLYTKATLNDNKEYLPDGTYSGEDNDILDGALAYYINRAGYRTRAGVVEAARFLLLRFKYKLNYFYENGRLEKDYDDVCDGEGRYYHRGLYLNRDKYYEISKSVEGPAYWGKRIYSAEIDEVAANGLDCSGFITWALYNGGYDCGDIGAGPSEECLDLSDFGEHEIIFDVDVKKLKVGDLVGFDGHVAMIVGRDDLNIYVGEAFWEGDLQISTYTYREFIEDSDWEYVMYMDSYYKNDGYLSDMW